jgi:hypothetical protein
MAAAKSRALALFLLVLSVAPALCAEKDFTFKKKEHIMVPKHTRENEVATIAHILQSVSTLEGITYWSQRRKRETVLYPRCYMVDNPQNRKKVPDSYDHMNSAIPAYYLQEDNSLGPSLYEVMYTQTADRVIMDVYTLDPLKSGPFVLVPARGLHLRIEVTDKGTALELDVLMEAALGRTNFAASYMDRSLQARFEAVFRWFQAMYEKEGK